MTPLIVFLVLLYFVAGALTWRFLIDIFNEETRAGRITIFFGTILWPVSLPLVPGVWLYKFARWAFMDATLMDYRRKDKP